jgi:1,4-dihydroxy-2-naphthoyl-CoA hydrolase
MYRYRSVIKLYQTDAAGLLFFARIFEIAHDAYQDFLEHIGYGMKSLLADGDYLIPIVHASADYKQSLFVGDEIDVILKIKHVGKSSVTMHYDIVKNETTAAIVQTVHVFLQRQTSQKSDIPNAFRDKLSEYLHEG